VVESQLPEGDVGGGVSGLRTLIIGGGVAGLTLAALLRQRGGTPLVVEQAQRSEEEGGYMLGLYYLGSRVLLGLGLFEEFLARSLPMRRYEIRDGGGEVVQRYELEALTRRVGPVRGITRTALIRLLRKGLGDLPVRTGTHVVSLRQHPTHVEATLSDGSLKIVDVVVGADGLHSTTRRMILEDGDFSYWETGWGGWMSWVDPDLAPPDTYMESWGPGRFVGLYPTPERLGVFFGGPSEEVRTRGPVAFLEEAKRDLGPNARPMGEVLESVRVEDDPFYWDFHDCRAETWSRGRVVLLGDAATGFLPTAGIGASMAMESASALADELSRTGRDWVAQSLRVYARRRKARVEAAQDSSRNLGRFMFLKSRPLAWGRDELVKHFSLESLIQSIADMMEEPI